MSKSTIKTEELDPELTVDAAADKFTRYAIAGLAAQGDLSDGDAARVLLAALKRWWGIDFIREAEKLAEED